MSWAAFTRFITGRHQYMSQPVKASFSQSEAVLYRSHKTICSYGIFNKSLQLSITKSPFLVVYELAIWPLFLN